MKYTRCCLIYCLSLSLLAWKRKEEIAGNCYSHITNWKISAPVCSYWGVGCALLTLNSLQDMDLALPWNPYREPRSSSRVPSSLRYITIWYICRSHAYSHSQQSDSCRLVPYSIMGYSCQEGPLYVKWVLRRGRGAVVAVDKGCLRAFEFPAWPLGRKRMSKNLRSPSGWGRYINCLRKFEVVGEQNCRKHYKWERIGGML